MEGVACSPAFTEAVLSAADLVQEGWKAPMPGEEVNNDLVVSL